MAVKAPPLGKRLFRAEIGRWIPGLESSPSPGRTHALGPVGRADKGRLGKGLPMLSLRMLPWYTSMPFPD